MGLGQGQVAQPLDIGMIGTELVRRLFGADHRNPQQTGDAGEPDGLRQHVIAAGNHRQQFLLFVDDHQHRLIRIHE